jgi:ectoine hydroxylase-related dioxygenase (phytanoyl-CoA dioxygenase family)
MYSAKRKMQRAHPFYRALADRAAHAIVGRNYIAMTTQQPGELREKGFAIVPRVFDSHELEHLKGELSLIARSDAVRRRGETYAIRNLLEICPAVQNLAESSRIRSLVRSILGDDTFPVRSLLFDKTAEANWLVPWHQDMTICVAEKRETPGYGPWSIKAGRWHVQPPTAVLAKMLSVRVHLDNCDESNGALRVIPSTHNHGRMSPNDIRCAEATNGISICSVESGGLLLLKPLLVHASSPARNPAHRRVIHIDFANSELHGGLSWRSRKSS